jgi:hypothetical protein
MGVDGSSCVELAQILSNGRRQSLCDKHDVIYVIWCQDLLSPSSTVEAAHREIQNCSIVLPAIFLFTHASSTHTQSEHNSNISKSKVLHDILLGSETLKLEHATTHTQWQTIAAAEQFIRIPAESTVAEIIQAVQRIRE